MFSFKNKEYSFEDGVEIIRQSLEYDYKLSFAYRIYKGITKDTYITCIYDKCFVVFQYSNQNDSLETIDWIKCDQIPTFVYLNDRYGDVIY